MTSHILIQLSVRRPHIDVPTLPPNASYDAVDGWWKTEGQTFMPPMTTKKNDIETGEDMKGE